MKLGEYTSQLNKLRKEYQKCSIENRYALSVKIDELEKDVDYLKEADTIALLHVDCDLYSSTKTIFNNLHPYIKKGTLIAFDEWCYNFSESFNDHEQKAFYEYVEQYNVQFEFIDYPVNDVETKLLKIL